MPDTHVHIMGYDENVVVFTVLSIVLLVVAALLARDGREVGRARAAH
jgi:hypothetical protein